MKVRHLGQVCIGPTLSRAKLRQAAAVIKNDRKIDQCIAIHQLLAGATRYKLIKLLSQTQELCVCDLAEILATTVSAVSHQLKLLRQAKIVTTRRQGQTIYYSLKNRDITNLL